jgi:hypothetical protein
VPERAIEASTDSVLERAIEAWTDKVSERAYQAPFCQMLIAQGHEILHSTRHTSLEFGKDIITRDPSGTICAFQLKGQPGGRLTKSGFSKILNQLQELITLPVSHPSVPQGTRHRAYLVTNGEIDEDAQRGIDDLKRGISNAAIGAFDFDVIRRGQFLSWAKDLSIGLWPSELRDWNVLLELLVADGKIPLPISKFDPLLRAVLLPGEPPFDEDGHDHDGAVVDAESDAATSSGSRVTAADWRRRVASAAVLTAVGLRSFELQNNHAAVATGWALFASYATAGCERLGMNPTAISGALDIAEGTILRSLMSLAEEACSRSLPVEAGLAEVLAYHLRVTLLCGYLGLLWFWLPDNEADLRVKIRAFLRRHVGTCHLWGEGAVPQLLFGIWALQDTGLGRPAEQLLIRYTTETLKRSLGEGPSLYGPYWDPETVLNHFWAEFLRLADDPLKDEDPTGDSFFSQALFHLIVRKNLKATCKRLWADYTKVSLRKFEATPAWARHLWRSRDGSNHTEISAPRRHWNDILEEAYRNEDDHVGSLAERPFLVGAIVLVFPHRCTTATIHYLADRFDSSWSHGAGSRTRG